MTHSRSNRPERTREPRRLVEGNAFHTLIQEAWEDDNASFEVTVRDLCGRRRRIDVLLDWGTDFVAIIELKNSDWDRMAPHRVRPNALRHARQVWSYMEPYLDVMNRNVCMGLLYPRAPKSTKRREEVEGTLNDLGIQVSWEDIDGRPKG